MRTPTIAASYGTPKFPPPVDRIPEVDKCVSRTVFSQRDRSSGRRHSGPCRRRGESLSDPLHLGNGVLGRIDSTGGEINLDGHLEKHQPIDRLFALGQHPAQAGIRSLHIALTQPVERESRLGHPPERNRLLVCLLDPWSSLQSPQFAEFVPGMAGHQLPVDGQVTARLLELGYSP